MRRIFVLFVLSLALFGCLGFGGGGAEKNLIPSKATGYMTMKYQEALSAIESAGLNATETAQFDKAKSEMQTQYGIDPTRITRYIVFFDYSGLPLGSSGSDQDLASKIYAGAIARGQFDEGTVKQKLEANGWVKSSYNGADYYTKEGVGDLYVNGPSAQKQVTAAALVDGAFVTGTEGAVKDVIDVNNGKIAALDDKGLSDAGLKVNKEALFFMAMKVPDSLRNQEAGTSAPGVDSFNGATHVALSIDKKQENVEMKVAVAFESSEQASKAGDALDGAVTMLRGFTKSGSASEAIVRGITVSSSGTYVTIDVKTTTDTLKKFSDEMSQQQSSLDSSYDGYGAYDDYPPQTEQTYPYGQYEDENYTWDENYSWGEE